MEALTLMAQRGCSLRQFNSIGVIGYGRFGALLVDLIRHRVGRSLALKIYAPERTCDAKQFFELDQVAACDAIVIAVPISRFEEVTQQISPLIKPDTLIVDVCSVREHPNAVLRRDLAKRANIIGSHPLFGPSTVSESGIDGQAVIVENLSCPPDIFKMFTESLSQVGIKIVDMSAEDHDRIAAETQFVALLLAEFVKSLALERRAVNTPSYSKLLEFIDSVGVDRSLIKDMLTHNRFAPQILAKLEQQFCSFCTQISAEPAR